MPVRVNRALLVGNRSTLEPTSPRLFVCIIIVHTNGVVYHVKLDNGVVYLGTVARRKCHESSGASDPRANPLRRSGDR